jgi:beta-1,4-mannosyltransferase
MDPRTGNRSTLSGGQRRKAFVSPFVNDTNQYVELHKELLRGIGFDVLPLSLRRLGFLGWKALREPQNIVCVHWLESRAITHVGALTIPSVKGVVTIAIYLLLFLMARAKVFYFVHNHAVHDTRGTLRKLTRGIVSLLCTVADVRVVHEPSYADSYRATYLPHPLYSHTEPVFMVRPVGTPLRCGVFGAIRPYKGIEDLLRDWPNDVKLLVRGRSTRQYAAFLAAIVARRGLAHDVAIESRFIPEVEFHAQMGTIDVLILPHGDGTMLVSGAFFAAIGRVRAIVLRDGPFARWACSNFAGVYVLRSGMRWSSLISGLAVEIELLDPARNWQLALGAHGYRACQEAYGQVLRANPGSG